MIVMIHDAMIMAIINLYSQHGNPKLFTRLIKKLKILSKKASGKKMLHKNVLQQKKPLETLIIFKVCCYPIDKAVHLILEDFMFLSL